MEKEERFLPKRGGAAIANLEADAARVGARARSAEAPRPRGDQRDDQIVRVPGCPVGPDHASIISGQRFPCYT
jgi:hypothetical protein